MQNRRSFFTKVLIGIGSLIGLNKVQATPTRDRLNGWIPLNEELPPIGQNVLIAWASGSSRVHLTEGMRKDLHPMVITDLKARGMLKRTWYWAVSWSKESEMLCWKPIEQPPQELAKLVAPYRFKP